MKRTVQMARAGVPSAERGAPPSPPSGRAKVIRPAAAIFLTNGAKAASDFLGGGMRAKILMPRVFRQAKYYVRRAKLFEQSIGQ